jgi:eukaryotic-like serine/threonine-protein kinase
MPLSAGTKLGPYEILAPIGEGGMGEVYKARDTRLDRIVAIKVAKDQFTDRFEREARLVAALNHPHICQLHDVGPNYLVFEYIDGAQLKGPMPPADALRIALQIVEALEEAHKHGIIHRDLKPGNILLTTHGVKVLDFGLAKQSRAGPRANDETQTSELTRAGGVMVLLAKNLIWTRQRPYIHRPWRSARVLEGFATMASPPCATTSDCNNRESSDSGWMRA